MAGTESLESRIADLEAKVAAMHAKLEAMHREIRTLADAVTRAVDVAMHVKLELDEALTSPVGRRRVTADEAE